MKLGKKTTINLTILVQQHGKENNLLIYGSASEIRISKCNFYLINYSHVWENLNIKLLAWKYTERKAPMVQAIGLAHCHLYR